ncbi:MAG: hypothetical protein Q9188_005066 [Gyalolechia gomerana]
MNFFSSFLEPSNYQSNHAFVGEILTGATDSKTSAPPKRIELARKYTSAFFECLNDEAYEYISTLPRDALNRAQRRILRQLAQDFSEEIPNINTPTDLPVPIPANTMNLPIARRRQPSQGLTIIDDDDDQVGVDIRPNPPVAARSRKRPRPVVVDSDDERILENASDPPATPRAPNKRGRPRTSTEGPAKEIPAVANTWGLILVLPSLGLPDIFQEELKTNPSHCPNRFLTDAAMPATASAPDLDVFLKFCSDVAQMPRRDDKNIVCRLFLFLTVGDMAHRIFGKEWWDLKRDRLKSRISRERGPETYNAIRSNVKLASRLTFICKRLSTGCLFWLCTTLSDSLSVSSPHPSRPFIAVDAISLSTTGDQRSGPPR